MHSTSVMININNGLIRMAVQFSADSAVVLLFICIREGDKKKSVIQTQWQE